MSITVIIVVLTCVVSFVAFSNQKIINDLIFYPPAISERNQWYRFITHGFIHADIMHLAFNMIALYSFGEIVEKYLYSNPCVFGKKGPIFYTLLYLGGLIFATTPSYAQNKGNYQYRSLGASGAVSAVVFAGILLIPQMPIRFVFIPVDIPGIVFGALYLIVSAYLSKKGSGTINHSAHFWGSAFGVIFTVVCVYMFGKLNVLENFINQVRSFGQILPFDCGL